MKKLLLGLALMTTASAQSPRVQSTLSGQLLSVNHRQVRVKDANGRIWVGQLTAGLRVDWRGQNLQPASLTIGQPMMFRLVGAFNAEPRQIDLIADLGSSYKYVAKGAPVPGYTPKGTFAGPNGVGGTPENAPDLGKLPSTGAYSVHGGFPHQNQDHRKLP